MPAPPQELMTANETAELLRIHKSTVYAAARRGELPVIRVGGSLRVVRDQLMAGMTRPTSTRRSTR